MPLTCMYADWFTNACLYDLRKFLSGEKGRARGMQIYLLSNLLPRVRLAGSRPYVRQLICNKLLFSSNIKNTAWGNGAARRPLAFFYM